jgi:hypothetical protein
MLLLFRYAQTKTEFNNDADFISRMETSVPENSMIFQLQSIFVVSGIIITYNSINQLILIIIGKW